MHTVRIQGSFGLEIHLRYTGIGIWLQYYYYYEKRTVRYTYSRSATDPLKRSVADRTSVPLSIRCHVFIKKNRTPKYKNYIICFFWIRSKVMFTQCSREHVHQNARVLLDQYGTRYILTNKQSIVLVAQLKPLHLHHLFLHQLIFFGDAPIWFSRLGE